MFPEIKTQKFCLRKIVSTDQQQIFEGLSDEVVIKYYGVSYNTFKETVRQMEWYDNLIKTGRGIWWGINFHGTTELIGACGFNNISMEHRKTEMGYWLLPQNWKKGIMIEVIPSIINYAFNILNLHRIEATVENDNLASKKLLIKLGFEYEGTLKECELKNEKFINLDYYALLDKHKF
jgi:[ribosomal protein S5]-alanine N-acetyltransferase